MSTAAAPRLADLTATELLDRYRRREITPSEVIADVLTQFEAVEPTIKSAVTVTADRAREQAKISDRRWHEGMPRRLEGLPVGLKDAMDVAGVRTTFGLARFRDSVAASTDPCVARILEAGAVLVAKLQVSQMRAHAGPFGTPRNPWQLEHGVGGSSSGSASALAARELPLTVGTDAIGSIRIPAAWAGVAGLKPTAGRVAKNEGSLVTATGPMARSAEDCGLLLQVMAGHDPHVPGSAPIAIDDYLAAAPDIRGSRLGVLDHFYVERCDAQVIRAFREACSVLERLGAKLEPVRVAHADLVDLLAYTTLLVPSASGFRRDTSYIPLSTRRCVAWADDISATDYERALRARRLIQREFAAAMDGLDGLLLPSAVAVAPRLDDNVMRVNGETLNYMAAFTLTTPANVTGFPALTVPCGFSADGLPVGLQIITAPFAESACLRVGRAYEGATTFHTALPPVIEGIRRGESPHVPLVDYSRHVPISHYGEVDLHVDAARPEGSHESEDGEADQWLIDEYMEETRRLISEPLRQLRDLDPQLLGDANVLAPIHWLEEYGRRTLGPAE